MKYQLYRHSYPILLLLVLITSCDAQNKPFVKDSIYTPETTRVGTLKIPKTPNSQNNNIHYSLQDKAGNLWFGTTGDGVYRYDGKSFVNFTEKDGLESNRVWCVLEDRDGNIWFGTDAGVSRYDPSAANSADKKPFQYFPIAEASTGNFFMGKPAAEAPVWSMMQDKTGKIWLGTQKDGIYYYDPTSAHNSNSISFTRFLDNKSVINKSGLRLEAVNCILEDKAGNIWFATWFEGLCRYDGKSLVSFKPNDEVWFSSMLEDKDGNIWVGRRSKGLFRFDPMAELDAGSLNHTNVSQHGTLDSCSVGLLLQDKSGNIWLGSIHSNMTKRETSGGLWRFDPSGKHEMKFKNFTAKDGLVNNNVWSAVEDREGNIWFGSSNTGLYRYDGKTFTSFSE